jgi:hypothetical protein
VSLKPRLSSRSQRRNLGREEDTSRDEREENDLLDDASTRRPEADDERDGQDRQEHNDEDPRKAHERDHPPNVLQCIFVTGLPASAYRRRRALRDADRRC